MTTLIIGLLLRAGVALFTFGFCFANSIEDRYQEGLARGCEIVRREAQA